MVLSQRSAIQSTTSAVRKPLFTKHCANSAYSSTLPGPLRQQHNCEDCMRHLYSWYWLRYLTAHLSKSNPTYFVSTLPRMLENLISYVLVILSIGRQVRHLTTSCQKSIWCKDLFWIIDLNTLRSCFCSVASLLHQGKRSSFDFKSCSCSSQSFSNLASESNSSSKQESPKWQRDIVQICWTGRCKKFKIPPFLPVFLRPCKSIMALALFTQAVRRSWLFFPTTEVSQTKSNQIVQRCPC